MRTVCAAWGGMFGMVKKGCQQLKTVNDEIKIEIFLYKAGWIGLFVLTGAYLLWKQLAAYDLLPHLSCVWKDILGIYCPGCGGTRAFEALIHGHVLQSLFYHPLIPYIALLMVLYMGSWSIYYLSKGRIWGIRFRPWYLYLSLVIIIIQCVYKNILSFSGHAPF